MKFALAQARPVTGDIDANVAAHRRLADLAILGKADAIIFPELSLTGYEPTLAADLAITPDDVRLHEFQLWSDQEKILIGVGVPLKRDIKITICMVIFKPHQPPLYYEKKFLHRDEEPFFASGENFPVLNFQGELIAPAICYELSVPRHVELAFHHGAKSYVASVVKSVKGIDTALQRLGEISSHYQMNVLMTNAVGECDGDRCAGRTSCWGANGKLLAQLNETSEGILIFNTSDHSTWMKYL